MEVSEFFPVWNKLTENQRATIAGAAFERDFPKGGILHKGGTECTGLILVQSGQLRAYTTSPDGKEITLYRLFERDMCLLSASCIMHSIQFEVMIAAEKDTALWVIPADVYKAVMEESAAAANYTNELMASRFSDVMWLIEEIMWKSLDKRIGNFLLEESAIEGSNRLHTTHETIANHLGTHREVVTRMLRYFQNEGMVKLARGVVEITD